MRHLIRVMLPLGREVPGWLHLMAPGGGHLGAWAALGRADRTRAESAGNPGLLSTRPYGHAPSGRFETTELHVLSPSHARMGAWCIPLRGITGDARVACEPPSMLGGKQIGGRTGLAIHAGRSGEELVPTYGCIRVGEGCGEALVRLLAGHKISVVVEDLG